MRFESAEEIEDYLDQVAVGEMEDTKQRELLEALAEYAERCPPRPSQNFDELQDVAPFKAAMTRSNPYLEEWIAFREAQREGGDDVLGERAQHIATIVKGKKRGASRTSKESELSVGYMMGLCNEFMIRDVLIKKYGFSVPDQKAIDLCVAQGPLIEIGAGRGYWKKLIEDAGGDVVAVDNFSDSRAAFNDEGYALWSDVKKGDHRIAARYPDRSLLIIWPPMGGYMAAKALLHHYRAGGQRLILVADKPSCAEDGFYDLVRQNYREVETHFIPRWTMMKDTLEIYERRTIPRPRRRKEKKED